MVEILKWELRLPFPYRGAQFPYFHRCVKTGLVTPSKSMTVSGIWTDQENSLHFNVLLLKAVCLALKSFQTENSKQKNSDSIRQRHRIWLSEQTRGGTCTFYFGTSWPTAILEIYIFWVD